MSKDTTILVVGEVIEALRDAAFRVELESGVIVLGHLSGKMRMNFIKIIPGDWVEIELSTYDPTKGRIVKRLTTADSKRLSREKELNQPPEEPKTSYQNDSDNSEQEIINPR